MEQYTNDPRTDPPHEEPSAGVSPGSDAPEVNPASDAFGYAPFARAIANALVCTPRPAGLVMAVDGVWGTGKTTLLNFVSYYLTSGNRDNAIDTPAPSIINFNPWWFSDRDQLAHQFLTEFRTQLPRGNEKLDKARESIAAYSDVFGEAAAWGLAAKTGVKLPFVAKLVAGLFRRLARRDKDIPQLKSEISDALRLANRRIVVFVDDIDRLAPDEIREVFKVIKAIADFPNVVYLLAFDRQLVAEALRSSLGIQDGDAYVEKIVQAQFSLPVVSKEQLNVKLFNCISLDSI